MWSLLAWHPPTQACHSWNSTESPLAKCCRPGAPPRSPRWQLHLASPRAYPKWNQHPSQPFPTAYHLTSFSPGAIALLSSGPLWCRMARSDESSKAPSNGSRPEVPNGPTALYEAMAKGFDQLQHQLKPRTLEGPYKFLCKSPWPLQVSWNLKCCKGHHGKCSCWKAGKLNPRYEWEIAEVNPEKVNLRKWNLNLENWKLNSWTCKSEIESGNDGNLEKWKLMKKKGNPEKEIWK